MRLLKTVGLPAAVCLAGWLGYPSARLWAGEYLAKYDTPKQADAILVLGGDFWGARVLKGAELGRQGFAHKVLISGPPYQNRPESELAIEFLVQRGYRKDLFTGIPLQAKSTIEEAIEVGPVLKAMGLRNVILVTRASHSRRASLVFRLFCPGIQFQSVPAGDEFQLDRWWTDAPTEAIVRSEWWKIAGTVLIWVRHWAL